MTKRSIAVLIFVEASCTGAPAFAGGSADLACRLLRVEVKADDPGSDIVLWDVVKKGTTTGLWDVAESVPTCVIFEHSMVAVTNAESEAHQIVWDRIDLDRRVLFPSFKAPATLISMSEGTISATNGLELTIQTNACKDAKPCAAKAQALVSATFSCAEEAEDRRGGLRWCRQTPSVAP